MVKDNSKKRAGGKINKKNNIQNTEYRVPTDQKINGASEFEGCSNLEKLILHPGIISISNNAFNEIGFKYIYRFKNGEIVFTKNKLEDEDAESIEYEIELNRIEGIAMRLNYDDIAQGRIKKETVELLYYMNENNYNRYSFTYEEYRKLIDLSEIGFLNDKSIDLLKVAIKNKTKFLLQYMEIIHCLSNQVILERFEFNEETCSILRSMIEKDFKMPYKQIMRLINNNQLKIFLENGRFDIYYEYIPDDLDLHEHEERGLINFANNLGCFSKEKIKDENGNETEELLAEKACKFLSEIINRKDIKLMDFCYMQLDLEPDQKFLDFISKKDNNKTNSTYYNLELLISAQSKYPCIFAIFMEKFNELQKEIVNLSEDFIEDLYKNNPFLGTNDDNRELAKEIYNLTGADYRDDTSNYFDYTYFANMSDAIRCAKTHKMPSHLAGVALHEGKTILDDITELKQQVSQIINTMLPNDRSLTMITGNICLFEWLSRYDKENYVLPYMLTKRSSYYDPYYVRNPEFQNLVIKNCFGIIIARAVLYLNKEKQYAVVRQYDDVYKESKYDKYREIIYDALKKGLNCFIENYNKQNPNNPLNNVCIEINPYSDGLSNFVKNLNKTESRFTIIPLDKLEYYPKDKIIQYYFWQREQSIDKRKTINNNDESR